ncbi:14693_t:CDS:2 [Ambispora leptoticha]|uniref:14693_t:CDS:1 n=1 Tax=Ambispora leptoticha TaxID=144679 RepID=A0A9N8VD54_9GLOM|nr:14693_t:CDS:2 [Ambispora leptoticha]
MVLIRILDFLFSVKVFEILILSFFYYIFRFYFNYFTRENPLHGPFPLPIIGNLHLIRGSSFEFAQKSRQQYGDLFELWLPNRNIYLNNANQIEKLTQPSTKSSFFAQMKLTKIFRKYLKEFGFVFLNDDHESWRYYRKILEQSLLNQKYQHALFDEVLECFKELQVYWEELGAERVIDIKEWSLRLFFDIMIRTTTGENFSIMTKYFNSLTTGPKINIAKEIYEMGEDIDQLLKKQVNAFSYFQLVPEALARSIFWWKTKKYFQEKEKVQSIYNEIVQKRKQENKNGDLSSRKTDILNILLNTNSFTDNNESIRLSDKEICVFLFEIINSSIHTTTNTFGFTIENIERNPNAKKKLLEELSTVFGDDKNNISYDKLSQLKYLEAIIYETRRVFPPIAIARINNKEVDVVGRKWHASTQFRINVHAIHHDPSLWHDPHEYKPERFLDEQKSNITRNSNLTFGTGLRICPGRFQAINMMKSIISLIYLNYQVELVDSHLPIKSEHTFMPVCLGGKVYLKPRNTE